MANNLLTTARYKILQDCGGNRYRFFCSISGAAVCTTGPFKAATREEELKLAWDTDGKKNFNRCKKCGKWIGDTMFNADVCECVDCAPWEEKPKYCTHCGVKITAPDIYCRKCGTRLRYKEVWL